MIIISIISIIYFVGLIYFLYDCRDGRWGGRGMIAFTQFQSYLICIFWPIVMLYIIFIFSYNFITKFKVYK